MVDIITSVYYPNTSFDDWKEMAVHRNGLGFLLAVYEGEIVLSTGRVHPPPVSLRCRNIFTSGCFVLPTAGAVCRSVGLVLVFPFVLRPPSITETICQATGVVFCSLLAYR